MLRIYGYAASINVRKVLWTCAEIGVDFESQDGGGPSLNPESNTIVRYLAASRGRADLLPVDPARRAHIEMWMDWQASDFNNSWRVAFQGLVRKNPDHQDATAIERSMASFSGMVAIVDAQLGKSGGYICGAQFSLADIPIGLSIHRWRSIPGDKPRLANIERYYERLCNRAAFRRYGQDGGP